MYTDVCVKHAHIKNIYLKLIRFSKYIYYRPKQFVIENQKNPFSSNKVICQNVRQEIAVYLILVVYVRFMFVSKYLFVLFTLFHKKHQ